MKKLIILHVIFLLTIFTLSHAKGKTGQITAIPGQSTFEVTINKNKKGKLNFIIDQKQTAIKKLKGNGFIAKDLEKISYYINEQNVGEDYYNTLVEMDGKKVAIKTVGQIGHFERKDKSTVRYIVTSIIEIISK